MAPTREHLLGKLASTITDYREGEVPAPDAVHVEKWVSQFPVDSQVGILTELCHVFERTYISRADTLEFLKTVATYSKFCGDNPKGFWKRASLLDCQGGGNSQKEMLALFRGVAEDQLGFAPSTNVPEKDLYVYIDDGIFSGLRVLQDLKKWITDSAPQACELRVIVATLHTGGQYYASKNLAKAATESGKKITFAWWRILEIESRKAYRNDSDVLWSTAAPTGELGDAYVQYITHEEPTYDLSLRSPGSIGGNKFFSSDAGRVLLEKELLDAGLRIREMCPNLPEVARPLGFTGLKTLGFGAIVVTFRNCPNNCPLAFWVGAPWYPLFPRSTNSDAFMKRLIESFRRRKAGKE